MARSLIQEIDGGCVDCLKEHRWASSRYKRREHLAAGSAGRWRRAMSFCVRSLSASMISPVIDARHNRTDFAHQGCTPGGVASEACPAFQPGQSGRLRRGRPTVDPNAAPRTGTSPLVGPWPLEASGERLVECRCTPADRLVSTGPDHSAPKCAVLLIERDRRVRAARRITRERSLKMEALNGRRQKEDGRDKASRWELARDEIRAQRPGS